MPVHLHGTYNVRTSGISQMPVQILVSGFPRFSLQLPTAHSSAVQSTTTGRPPVWPAAVGAAAYPLPSLGSCGTPGTPSSSQRRVTSAGSHCSAARPPTDRGREGGNTKQNKTNTQSYVPPPTLHQLWSLHIPAALRRLFHSVAPATAPEAVHKRTFTCMISRQ